MRNFQVTVNGKVYDVAVEETTGGAAPAVAVASVAAANAAVPAAASAAPVAKAPAPAAAKTPAAVAGTAVKSPMPGNIVHVAVSVGMIPIKNPVTTAVSLIRRRVKSPLW